MKFRRMATVTAIVLVSTLTALSASASEVLFTGSGVFGPGISTLLPVEVPNGVFSFSFDLPNPISANPTTQVTNSDFVLNGMTVADNITSVLFYPAAEGGGIDLRFANDAIISLYMADIGSNLTLLPGTYAFTIDSPTPEAGNGTLTLTAVPEPDTWALMIAGIGGLGLALRAARPRRVKSWALAA